MALTPALGGLFSSFIIQHAWTASRFLAYGLGPLLVWVRVMSRIRCVVRQQCQSYLSHKAPNKNGKAVRFLDEEGRIHPIASEI